jgi:hypothetical protein
MNLRSVIAVILGMSLSFCAIFLVLRYVVDPAPRDRDLGRQARWRPPPVDDDIPRRRPGTAARGTVPSRREAGNRRADIEPGSGSDDNLGGPLESNEKAVGRQASATSVDSAVAAASAARWQP